MLPGPQHHTSGSKRNRGLYVVAGLGELGHHRDLIPDEHSNSGQNAEIAQSSTGKLSNALNLSRHFRETVMVAHAAARHDVTCYT